MRFICTTTALAVSLSITAVPSALAYPQDPNTCNDSTISWVFDASWNNYPTAKSWARAAINLWNQPRDYAGARLVTVTEVQNADAVQVQLKDKPLNELGSSECTFGASIYLNRAYVGSSSVVHQVARHEIGHLLGMEHSGQEDSRNRDNPPTMVTCVDTAVFPTTNRLAQDDQAYVNWLHGTLANRQLHANVGFEQGDGLWGAVGGTIEWLPGGGATGPGHVRFKTSTHTSFVYQTVNLATGDDAGHLPYRAVANYRVAPGHDGLLEARMSRRAIDYTGDNTCEYPDGLQNLNAPVYSTSGYVNHVTGGVKDLAVATTWVASVSAWEHTPVEDGFQMQIRVYSHATDAWGTDQYVYLDNVRGEGQ